MGLRFRKSISILPGMRVNFGLTGMSVSAGVPGFRKTFHTSGRTTTTVGIPGTGLYYVDVKGGKRNNAQSITRSHASNDYVVPVPTPHEVGADSEDKPLPPIRQINKEELLNIHKQADDTIDWTEVLSCQTPPDTTYNSELWSYYHEMAPKVLSGDIDAYLQLIFEINPLDDLLDYGNSFQFGTDDSHKIEIEYAVNEQALETLKHQISATDYNELLQDYICSISIRIARDMFALLPVSTAIINAMLGEKLVLSVRFDRSSLSKVKFGYIDPSKTVEQFEHHMSFSVGGFNSVDPIE